MSLALPIRVRVVGFDPEWFWQAAPGLAEWQAMLAKYTALAELAQADEAMRMPGLRRAAAQWPGSLREAELIGPIHVDARATAAARGVVEPDRSRASWVDEPALAVLGWARLHRLLADLRRFRASQIKPHAGESEAFARWLSSAPDPIRARWPSPDRIVEVTGPKLRARSAYLWLAATAGLELPRLNVLLLARAGHWDRRVDDPAWAHEP